MTIVLQKTVPSNLQGKKCTPRGNTAMNVIGKHGYFLIWFFLDSKDSMLPTVIFAKGPWMWKSQDLVNNLLFLFC